MTVLTTQNPILDEEGYTKELGATGLVMAALLGVIFGVMYGIPLVNQLMG